MKNEINFSSMASHIMYGSGITLSELESKFNVELRKGKTVEDIRAARTLAGKRGKFKTEHEHGFLEIYLSKIFKARKEGSKHANTRISK